MTLTSSSSTDHAKPEDDRADSDKPNGRSVPIIRIFIIPVLILCAGAAVYYKMVSSKTKPERSEVVDSGLVVETVVATSSSTALPIQGSGTVLAKKELNLSSDVSGKLTWVNPKLVPGARFKRGVRLCRVDTTDYRASVAAASAAKEQAQRLLSEAISSAKIAKEEWESSHPGQPASPLVLQEPAVNSAKAELISAKATLAQAKAKLGHTSVRAPFDLQIRSETVESGQFVSPGQTLMQVFGTAEAEVSVPLSIESLSLIGAVGSAASIVVSGRRASHEHAAPLTGTVSRIIDEIDPQTRTASVVVSVKDPYRLKIRKNSKQESTRQTLPIGSFVNITFEGKTLGNVYELPNKALRDDNTVWIDDKGKLAIKQVVVAFQSEGTVFITSGLNDGDKIITSRIGAPLAGMVVRTVDPKNTEETTQPRKPLHEKMPHKKHHLETKAKSKR